MSNVGKTQLKGHGLHDEGATVYAANGRLLGYHTQAYREGRAKCRCGALSPAGLTRNAAQKWHREHKDAIRAAAPQCEPAPSGRGVQIP